MSEWISVRDRLPDNEDDVLVLVREIEFYSKHKEKRKVYHWVFTGWHIDGEWATTYCHGHRMLEKENKEYPECEHTVTHWMPLPELQKEEKGEIKMGFMEWAKAELDRIPKDEDGI